MKKAVITLSKLFFISTFLIAISCEKKVEPIIEYSNELIGTWVNPVAIDSSWKYERANSLNDNGYGFSFSSENLFVERKNAGWCGTPPITYANFDGTWERNDSIIDITVLFWGGLADYRWKIISIENNTLVINMLKAEYQYQKQ